MKKVYKLEVNIKLYETNLEVSQNPINSDFYIQNNSEPQDNIFIEKHDKLKATIYNVVEQNYRTIVTTNTENIRFTNVFKNSVPLYNKVYIPREYGIIEQDIINYLKKNKIDFYKQFESSSEIYLNSDKDFLIVKGFYLKVFPAFDYTSKRLKDRIKIEIRGTGHKIELNCNYITEPKIVGKYFKFFPFVFETQFKKFKHVYEHTFNIFETELKKTNKDYFFKFDCESEFINTNADTINYSAKISNMYYNISTYNELYIYLDESLDPTLKLGSIIVSKKKQNSYTESLSGKSEPNSVVIINNSDGEIFQTVSDLDGIWEISPNPLKDGEEGTFYHITEYGNYSMPIVIKGQGARQILPILKTTPPTKSPTVISNYLQDNKVYNLNIDRIIFASNMTNKKYFRNIDTTLNRCKVKLNFKKLYLDKSVYIKKKNSFIFQQKVFKDNWEDIQTFEYEGNLTDIFDLDIFENYKKVSEFEKVAYGV